MIVIFYIHGTAFNLRKSDFMLIYVHINNPGMTRPYFFFKVGGNAVVVVRR